MLWRLSNWLLGLVGQELRRYYTDAVTGERITIWDNRHPEYARHMSRYTAETMRRIWASKQVMGGEG